MNAESLYHYDLSRTEWCRLIDEYVFDERDRAMLKRRLLDGIIYERLAEEFNMSVAQIKRRVAASSRQLFKHL